MKSQIPGQLKGRVGECDVRGDGPVGEFRGRWVRPCEATSVVAVPSKREDSSQ